jgi:NAD(P)-dependent dehydrogenase (short-subunit alcohol dehydrogenase family)
MILSDKSAVIYGAGGAIGRAVARAFASEGAKLFLTGHTLAPLKSSPMKSSPPADPPRRRRWTRSTSGLSTSISSP